MNRNGGTLVVGRTGAADFLWRHRRLLVAMAGAFIALLVYLQLPPPPAIDYPAPQAIAGHTSGEPVFIYAIYLVTSEEQEVEVREWLLFGDVVVLDPQEAALSVERHPAYLAAVQQHGRVAVIDLRSPG